MKARHDWSPQARDQFFGPEPMARDPLPVHSEAVERCRSVLGAAHHESLRALSSNEATTYLLEERLATLRNNMAKRRERLDEWTLTLQQHGLDSVEREVDWLSQLIDQEIDGNPPSSTSTGTGPASK